MKKYTMLSALWLFACGAGAGQEPADDSTLRSPLTANDDDATDPTESSAEDTGSAEEPEWSDAGDCEGPATPVAGGTFPAGPGSAAPGTVPDLVIGAGGTPWAPPPGASVVWCNVDVPIGCPAISPAPEGGRLVVVHGMTEASGTGIGAAGSGSGSEMGTAGSGSGGEWSAQVDDPAVNAGGTFVVYVSPDTAGGAAGAAPSTEVPVIIGGSLPPLPGTCVAVTFPTAGGTIGDAPIPAGAPSAGGERVGVPAGEPTSGGSPASGATAGGRPAFPGTLPALPPPGECLGITFPTAPDRPAVPGQPVPDGSVAPVPAPPAAGACVHVGFATSADPDQPTPSPVPVMCAFPASPGAGVAAAPSAGGEPTPDEDLR
jgi:hypothetical protein